MTKRVAVLADATSAGFWFPKWHRYYANEFGPDALHIVTYQGKRTDFRSYNLGGIWDVPQAYNDVLRAKLISSLVRTLLTTYDVVIRCDVDEFLIPDLRKYRTLREYINRLDYPYVTAYGVDVFEKEGDIPLDMERPILVSQRSHGIVTSTLHKTSITTIPLEWSSGFHGATAIPVFNFLYIFHMKFADVYGRSSWMQHMKAGVEDGSSEYKYFSFSVDQMKTHKAWLSSKPCSPHGWTVISNIEEQENFLSTVVLDDSGIHYGKFTNSDISFVIPLEFRDLC